MKKYFLPIICMLISFNIAAQNVDEVLAKYETANGGKNIFASIKTLQYTSVVSMNMMGMPIDITMTNIFVMGKLYRRQTSGMMGMKGSYTLVTDTAGYTSTPTVPAFGDFPGMDGGIKKMDKEALQKLQSKLKSIDDFSTLVDAFSVAKAAPVSYATVLTSYVAMQCQLLLASRGQIEAWVL